MNRYVGGIRAYSAAPTDRRGLTARQAVITFGIVFLLALATCAAQFFTDLDGERQRIISGTGTIMKVVVGSAAEAATQGSTDLADRVVEGMFVRPEIEAASLRDASGEVLAQRSHAVMTAGSWQFDLFSDITSYSLQLMKPGTADELVGSLAVRLSGQYLTRDFLHRIATSLILLLAQALAVCGVVVFLFHLLIAKPLVGLSGALRRVDVASPIARPVPIPRGHAGDELGSVAENVNALLAAFQESLDRRAEAEASLRELAHDLEGRVQARTRDLQGALAQIQAEKKAGEEAFRRLEKANIQILDSIHYARKIQISLLPDHERTSHTVRELSVLWEPLDLVGGDFYWIEDFGYKSLFLVADCTGHGVPGAMMTMVVSAALDTILHLDREFRPSRVLERLDELVRERLRQDRPTAESDDGLDAAVCVYDRIRGTVTFAGASMALLYGEAGSISEIRGERTSLGYRIVRRKGGFKETEIVAEPGRAFYLFTDGLSDQMGGQPARLLGRRRIREILAGLDEEEGLEAQIAGLSQALAAYRGTQPLRDDMTILAFRPC